MHSIYRPHFHFTAPKGWLNDPNGLLYVDGVYHLFYQYYPDDIVWGPMHWGHASSNDLVDWGHHPIVLYPDDQGYIFSGSAVHDVHNTTQFGDDTKPPLVAIFTCHRKVGEGLSHETQALAFSLDNGKTWSKFDGNPVLPNPDKKADFRDPFVFWHDASERWVMALSVHDHVEFYNSSDLKFWEKLSEFGTEYFEDEAVWECVQLFSITEYQTEKERWVLIQSQIKNGPQGGSGTQYFIGEFDGIRFKIDPEFAAAREINGPHWIDSGADNYAGVTWNNAPTPKTEQQFIGWMSNWKYALSLPTKEWRGSMTLPRTLTLRETTDGLRLFSQPVEAFKKLRGFKHGISETLSNRKVVGLAPQTLRRCELDVTLKSESPNGVFGLELKNGSGDRYKLSFDKDAKEIISDRTQVGNNRFSPKFANAPHRIPATLGPLLSLRIFVDLDSIEIFINDGEIAITELYFSQEPFNSLVLFTKDNASMNVEGSVYELRPIELRSSPQLDE